MLDIDELKKEAKNYMRWGAKAVELGGNDNAVAVQKTFLELYKQRHGGPVPHTG